MAPRPNRCAAQGRPHVLEMSYAVSSVPLRQTHERAKTGTRKKACDDMQRGQFRGVRSTALGIDGGPSGHVKTRPSVAKTCWFLVCVLLVHAQLGSHSLRTGKPGEI